VLVLKAGAADGGAKAPTPAAAAAAAKPAHREPAKTEPAKAPPAAPTPTRITVVTVPDIGDYHDVPVIEVFVKDGDRVEKDAPLVTLESEKATMDVPAPAAGVVRALKLKLGDRVSRGSAICDLETADTATTAAVSKAAERATASATPAEATAAAPAREEAASLAPPAVALSSPNEGPLPHASPSIRKFARELGVELARLNGSGPRGRITRDDVQAFVKSALRAGPPAAVKAGSGIPPIPAVDFSQFGAIETKPLPRIRKLSATNLHRAWVNVPHVTQTDEADITELEAFRKTQSEELAAAGKTKLTLLPFLMKACQVALQQYPEFNSSLAADGESLILKKYCHIGFAADTPNGLVVPVVRDVDRKGVAQLAAECAELAKKARDGKLKADEMKGGCFTVSSLGGIGGSYFTPIINAPEVAILGVSRSQMKPVWDGSQFTPRLMVPLSLSYDHRVIDGAAAARFIVLLTKLLSDLRRILL
jgi:pyruvate dehydrogenase E2 component (dihydrolipoamide acetyltransferase)